MRDNINNNFQFFHYNNILGAVHDQGPETGEGIAAEKEEDHERGDLGLETSQGEEMMKTGARMETKKRMEKNLLRKLLRMEMMKLKMVTENMSLTMKLRMDQLRLRKLK